jgi:phosphinothricin acetyltransferase
MDWALRNAVSADADAIADIYNHYIENSTATFEEQVLAPADLAARISQVEQAGLPWLVAERGGEVHAYAYATEWRARTAYRHSVEVSAYVRPDQSRGGMGTALYSALIERLGTLNKHSLIAVVTLPNPASAAFHEKLGFRQVAHLKEVGYKFEQWLDVGYWQRVLSYTSKF